MMPAQIHVTPTGILVRATARDFPSLTDLAPFLDLKPDGCAQGVAGRLDGVEVLGRVA